MFTKVRNCYKDYIIVIFLLYYFFSRLLIINHYSSNILSSTKKKAEVSFALLLFLLFILKFENKLKTEVLVKRDTSSPFKMQFQMKHGFLC